ncbi:PAS domain S-box-containing protein/diguanylate cyclase (GGDEF)-like protein [Paucimonas lemoignei]|uniref:PAS domain S-box-containing protein/diguanylate cyclase (GGDEF)-like protein n=1 Tax=Paucimonas lemoignei TaxID=29443 RepID=A0A4R3HSF6_PAULE|nr:EAL domain-containing protein [Paucimonas lemoignei]TCS33739.1 PAS domain S-box-containing protein/diguanylate cyclase (GGDEF)-like protein [Paucimonas lemoignei]
MSVNEWSGTEALEIAEQRFREFADAMPHIIWTARADGTIDYVNQVYRDFVQRDLDVPSQSWIDILHPDDVTPTLSAWQHAVATGTEYSIEFRALHHTSGKYRWLAVRGKPVRDEAGNIRKWYGICTDIQSVKEAQSEIQRLANLDQLTGLPNRRLLQDRLEHAMRVSSRNQQWGAVMLIDLDNFKLVNDTQGHSQGDVLIQQVAQRLARYLRGSDTVARLGGDEFIVILESIGHTSIEAGSRAAQTGEKILAILGEPFQLCNSQHSSTASIGASLFHGTQRPAEELLKRAEAAMYQAKAAGRNLFCFYDPVMQSAISKRMAIEDAIRHSLEHELFTVHYQPQVDLHERVIGAEALLRWTHPDYRHVSPAEFIPVAENSGQILQLGQWVLQSACEQLAAWARHPATARLTLAVNVSAKQFRHPEFIHQVIGIIETTGIHAGKLKLEITETALIENISDAVDKILVLKKHGIGMSLDDFGVGYSSLAYLCDLPLDQIKLDRSFIRRIPGSAKDMAILQAMIMLGQKLGLTIVAEGVESTQQLHALTGIGCQHFQGFLFSKPLPAPDFAAYLQKSVAD